MFQVSLIEMIQLKKGTEMAEVAKQTHNDLKVLEEIIQSNDHLQLAAFFENLSPVDSVRAFFRLSKENQIRLLEMLGPEESAHLILKI